MVLIQINLVGFTCFLQPINVQMSFLLSVIELKDVLQTLFVMPLSEEKRYMVYKLQEGDPISFGLLRGVCQPTHHRVHTWVCFVKVVFFELIL